MSSADFLLQAARITAPPVDVRGLLEVLDIELKETDDPGWSGALTVNSKTYQYGATLWVPVKDGEIRKRYTLAHLLGHLVLHSEELVYRETTFRGNWKEAQANRFACNLLAPLWMIGEISGKDRYNIKAMAKRFEVSPKVIETQLYLLAL